MVPETRTPTEDNYVDWILLDMVLYLRNVGFTVFTYSVGQRREGDIPFDRIIIAGTKAVAFQFKRPYRHRLGFRWRLDRQQHLRMRQYNWIYYCLPTFDDPTRQAEALHHCIFVEPEFEYRRDLDWTLFTREGQRYSTWGPFVENLRRCPVGKLIANSKSDLEEFLRVLNQQPEKAITALNEARRESHVIWPVLEGQPRAELS